MDAGRQVEQWFQEYEKDITNYLVYFTGSMDVEDLVQETFLKAFQSCGRFKFDSNPKTWLISIARNAAIDFYRKRSVWQNLKEKLSRQPSQIESAITEELFIKKAETARLLGAIHTLKTNYRDVVLLRGIAELSAEETGEVLGWTENKVNVTFHRAVKKLNLLLKEDEQSDTSF
ncbi:RNA polymerase sigma factor [Bacillus sp. ISL-47]|uniref:RNA polymerase sigma factor n=1 Tax=Bacillus sp. ISL-47 TaxID=2819130 RepID=UPI001BE88BF5|nr:RNA polymerase sigma factor [Bacillus sp. ISL-47]MBT2691358.1 RNA polymerase sigma factor [Bacillus sp. ISL-47]MBT2711149.1 RNA polymerase sigma factor [Pseudomonas sp. ISL-84]